MRKTKIVCTIGPATRDPRVIETLIKAGMNVARLNFSHETREVHGKIVDLTRDVAKKLNQPVAILQDLAGPKIRTGNLATEKVVLEPGQEFILTSRDVPGNDKEVSVSYKSLPDDVQPGDKLLLSDGALELRAEKVVGQDIHCKVIHGGPLGSRKGINLPDRPISVPILNDKDKADLKYGLEKGVDYVAISFVRHADDVQEIRALMNQYHGDALLIAKIEKHEALTNLDAIIAEADGAMVARGDLGVEIPIEDVPRVQKMIIEKCNQAGKPVITATQMLMSMVNNPRPTRAEATDVANAILDGSDGVMLSEETTIGKYPELAVAMMARIAISTETGFPFMSWADRYEESHICASQEAVAQSACTIANRINAKAVITTTQSGSTTRLVAKYRPSQLILAMTPDKKTYCRLSLVWGAIPMLMEKAPDTDTQEKLALSLALKSGYVKSGENVVLTAGVPLHVAGTTNLIKIATVE